MLKSEFEGRIGKEISEEDYQIIDTVYCWYPCCELHGLDEKDFYANLYKVLGMRVFRDMYPLAKQIVDTEQQVRALQAKLNKLRGIA